MKSILSFLAAAFLLLPVAITKARADSDVVVEKEPMRVSVVRFDPNHLPDPPPPIPNGLDADTSYVFKCQAHIGFDFVDQGEPQSVSIEITSLKATLGLPVIKWLPNNASQRLIDHEQGHCVILERIYQGAEDAAYASGRRTIGKVFTGAGVDRSQSQQAAVTAAIDGFANDYHLQIKAVADEIGNIYDDITSHGRKESVTVDQAIDQAFKRWESTHGRTLSEHKSGATKVSSKSNDSDEMRSPPRSEAVIKNLSYVPGSHTPAQTLDLYMPKARKKAKDGEGTSAAPLVVWLHPGGWRGGSKANPPFEEFVKNGYAFASVDYRPSTQAPFPAQIYDCKAAVRFLRAHGRDYGINAERIGVLGSSAGGHLAALLGTTGNIEQLEGNVGDLTSPSNVQAVCTWAGIMDFQSITKQAGGDTLLELSSPVGPVAQLLGGLPAERADAARLASPTTYARPNCPPFLIMHGDQDNVVPLRQSEELVMALKAFNNDVTLAVVRKGAHDLNTAQNRKQARIFFDKQIK